MSPLSSPASSLPPPSSPSLRSASKQPHEPELRTQALTPPAQSLIYIPPVFTDVEPPPTVFAIVELVAVFIDAF
ncbi:hypothetical protein TIFTF001_015423 [Ficus carica]|uniref:Uncharacterized protein n=1 Tax=Ficus carica TaxID=3494 RepID=A0AA88D8Y4_FICCA|nr:hypothetical protein TIFTF001_015423 [Ficus carica]